MNLRDRVDIAFDAWGRFTYRQRWKLIVGMVLLAAGLASQMTGLAIDNSVEAFLREDDPARLAYAEFREQFGGDQLAIVAVRPSQVFDLAFLNRLRSFHDELEREVPYVEEITSLVNARSTRGEGDRLIVEDLMEDWPETAADVAALRSRVEANPLYQNVLVSEGGRLTTVSIELSAFSPSLGFDVELGGFEDAPGGEPAFLTHAETAEALRAIRAIMARYDSSEFRLHLAGAPCLNDRLSRAMTRDMILFTLLGITVVACILFLLFRRISAVLLPLFVVTLALGATFGLMGISHISLSTLTEVLPAFLLVVGVCDSVHILVIFYQRLALGDGRQDAIASTLSHSGLAILMTSLTTAGGLLSFVAAELAPIAQLGVFAPIGVMFAFVATVALLPALLAVVPLRHAGERKTRPMPAILNRTLRWCGHVSTRHPGKIVTVALASFAVSLTGVAQLRFSHDAMRWFPETEPIRMATSVIDRELRGSLSVELILRSEREDDMQRPERLNELDTVKRRAESFVHGELFIGKAISLADIVKEIHQALNSADPRSYRIPQDRQLVAQELLLFESAGTDALEDVVDSRFTTTRVSMKVPQSDATLFPDFLARFEEDVRRVVGAGVQVETTGIMALLARTFSRLIESMARSYAIALLVITPLMILLIGRLRWGLLSMPPNLAPILLVLGVMGWLGIPIDIATLLIGGIMIGLAVDDTIHFMHNFARYYSRTMDAVESVHLTLQTSGMAMLVTTLILSAGFITFTGGYMVNVAYFGALCALAAIVAFVADVLLAPALMVLVTRGDPRPP